MPFILWHHRAHFLSPGAFAWQALVQLELGGRGFDCSAGSGLRAIGIVPGAQAKRYGAHCSWLIYWAHSRNNHVQTSFETLCKPTSLAWAYDTNFTHQAGPRTLTCTSVLCGACAHAELLPDSEPLLARMKAMANSLGKGCVASGDAVLSLYAQPVSYATSLLILLGYYVLLLVAAYLAARRVATKQRG